MFYLTSRDAKTVRCTVRHSPRGSPRGYKLPNMHHHEIIFPLAFCACVNIYTSGQRSICRIIVVYTGIQFDLTRVGRHSTLESHSSLWLGLRLDQSQVELYTTQTIQCSVRTKTTCGIQHSLSRACHSNRSIYRCHMACAIARLVSQLEHIICIPNAAPGQLFSVDSSSNRSTQGVFPRYLQRAFIRTHTACAQLEVIKFG